MTTEEVQINMDGELECVDGTNKLYTGKSETNYDNGNSKAANLPHISEYINFMFQCYGSST